MRGEDSMSDYDSNWSNDDEREYEDHDRDGEGPEEDDLEAMYKHDYDEDEEEEDEICPHCHEEDCSFPTTGECDSVYSDLDDEEY